MYKVSVFDKNVFDRFMKFYSITEISKALGISGTLLRYKIKVGSNFNEAIQVRWYEFLKIQSKELSKKLDIINTEIKSIESYKRG
jgi:hypothetical protein